jgi:2,3-bisphosphoglycerate-independent phosphoglycerate mutase
MLGYRPEEFPGRAVLEARGNGIEVSAERVYAYAALRSGRVEDGVFRVTGRVRDDAPVPPALAGDEIVTSGGQTARCRYVGRGEGILEVAGEGVDERVTDSDPFFRERDPVLRPLPLTPAARQTATTAEAWMRSTLRVSSAGGTVGTLKWWGRPRACPAFPERHGLEGAVVAASRFHAGLADVLGLRFHRLPETTDLEQDLVTRLDDAAELLAQGTQVVFVHHKGSDEAGHSKDPAAKVAATEAFDRALARLASPPFDTVAVCVTGDHATPAAPEMIHSGDPVPLVLAGPGIRADRVDAWSELACSTGILGHLRGEDLMHVLLNAADRVLFAGSRPTPVAFAAGHPAAPEAFGVG